jgi:hypothetical protein
LFTTIGEVAYAPGGGYAYTDVLPLTGNNFYRIAERDHDGKLTYSPVRLVMFSGSGLIVSVAPVPTYTHTVRLSVETAADDEPMQAVLVNPIGQVMKVFTIKQGVNTLNLGSLGSGLYYLKVITNKNASEIRKIVIQ